MCFVLGLIFGKFTISIQPLLSSNIEQCILGVLSSEGIALLNSLNKSSSGITSLSDCESATYSLSVVDSVISVWSLEHYIMGQFAYIMMYPVLDITDDGSSLHSIFDSHAKDAST